MICKRCPHLNLKSDLPYLLPSVPCKGATIRGCLEDRSQDLALNLLLLKSMISLSFVGVRDLEADPADAQYIA